MERSVAIKKLGKLLGKKLGYRVDPTAPMQDERDEATSALKIATEERKGLQEQCDARSKAILEADAEYQRLRIDYRAARERADKLLSITHHYKFTVGTSTGMFFQVWAQGDSWEQVIAKLEAEQRKRVA